MFYLAIESGTMKNYYFTSYKNFKCIADKCPDSCCKDWDVVVDDMANEFYNSVKTPFGDKIRSVTTIDADGDRIFTLNNGKCPFWNKEKLCDIFINLGEEHLCKTCAEFPRITQDYTDFAEHMLSLACPEATKIILSNENPFELCCVEKPTTETVDYNTNFMMFLKKAREISVDIINNFSLFSDGFQVLYSFNEYVQSMIDDDDFDCSKLETLKYPDDITMISESYIFNLHSKFDVMDKNYKELIDKAIEAKFLPKIHTKYESEFKKLALYYIYRYYLTAIDSYDVLITIVKLISACTVIGKIEDFCHHQNGTLPLEKRVEIVQRYSKEIEHSYENQELFIL